MNTRDTFPRPDAKLNQPSKGSQPGLVLHEQGFHCRSPGPHDALPKLLRVQDASNLVIKIAHDCHGSPIKEILNKRGL